MIFVSQLVLVPLAVKGLKKVGVSSKRDYIFHGDSIKCVANQI